MSLRTPDRCPSGCKSASRGPPPLVAEPKNKRLPWEMRGRLTEPGPGDLQGRWLRSTPRASSTPVFSRTQLWTGHKPRQQPSEQHKTLDHCQTTWITLHPHTTGWFWKPRAMEWSYRLKHKYKAAQYAGCAKERQEEPNPDMRQPWKREGDSPWAPGETVKHTRRLLNTTLL